VCVENDCGLLALVLMLALMLLLTLELMLTLMLALMLALISAGTGADASADDDTSALAEADTSFNVDAGATNDSVGANVGSTASAHASDFDVGVEMLW
jgi:hypothetical protein